MTSLGPCVYFSLSPTVYFHNMLIQSKGIIGLLGMCYIVFYELKTLWVFLFGFSVHPPTCMYAQVKGISYVKHGVSLCDLALNF